MLKVNAVGPLLVTKHFLPLLRKSSVRPKIVNISSAMGSLTKNREHKKEPMVSRSWMLQDFLINQAGPQHWSGPCRTAYQPSQPSRLPSLCIHADCQMLLPAVCNGRPLSEQQVLSEHADCSFVQRVSQGCMCRVMIFVAVPQNLLLCLALKGSQCSSCQSSQARPLQCHLCMQAAGHDSHLLVPWLCGY